MSITDLKATFRDLRYPRLRDLRFPRLRDLRLPRLRDLRYARLGRREITVMAIALLVVLDIGLLFAALSRHSAHEGAGQSASASPGADQARAGAPAQTPPSTSQGGTGAPSRERVELANSAYVAEPFETVRIDGRYFGAGAGTTLRLQRQQQGDWVNFPLPTTTDRGGRFTAYVELGKPGSHRLRVVDPGSGTSSEVVVVNIG